MKNYKIIPVMFTALFLTACSFPTDAPYSDPAQPVVTDLVLPTHGVVSLQSKAVLSISISWTPGSDNVTDSANLEYAVYRSTTDNISNYTEAQTIGIRILDWTKNRASTEVSGLIGDTDYFISVFVRDTAGNTNRYATFNAKTLRGVTITWCDIQFPSVITTTIGNSTSVYGQYYAQGVTTIGTAAPAVIAQLGWYPVSGSQSSAQYINAGFYTAIDNNHEYAATLSFGTAGSYFYFYRYSGDCGETWAYTTNRTAIITN